MLIGKTWGAENAHKGLESIGKKPRLLGKFPSSAGDSGLSRLKLTGGNLKRHTAKSDAILANQADAPIVIERNDAGSAMVANDLSVSTRTVRELNVERPRLKYLPPPPKPIIHDLFLESGIRCQGLFDERQPMNRTHGQAPFQRPGFQIPGLALGHILYR